MKNSCVRASLLVLLLFFSRPQSHAQTDPQVAVLNSHFAGIWVGINDDYTKQPMLTTPLILNIREEPKKKRLRLDYFYGSKGRSSSDRHVRYMAFDPVTSTVILNWKHDSKEQYHADHLAELLRAGYGDLEISGTFPNNNRGPFLRATFHLEADRLTYFWETSSDGVNFYKTADWTLTREKGTNSLPAPQPNPTP